MKRLILLLLVPIIVLAQQEPEHKSIHQLDMERHANVTMDESPSNEPSVPFLPKVGSSAALSKKVYGWHPYWAASTAYLSYDYTVLSHIAFFSYEVDTATGGYTTIRGWDTTPIIAYAHQRGVKVTLTVTNFGNDKNDKILSDTVKQNRLITTLITLLKSRNGDGVNFDLESVRLTQRANLVSFMRRATTRIKAEIPGAEISMASPAVDWSGSWDFNQLGQICDYLIFMGYDYYWSGSTTAGPVAPLEGENYNVTRSADAYIAAGVPREKILIGVPWYGLDWPVQTSARKAAATGTASSRTYIVAEPMAASYGKQFDQLTKVPWFSYFTGTVWRQVWYDDSLSLALKYNLVTSRALGGIGIWALSYDGARQEIWNGIKAAFSTTGIKGDQTESSELPMLLRNYPNPFNPATNLEFRVSSFGLVSLRVFDVLGREIATLVDEMKSPGTYTVRWDAGNLPSGAYFGRLHSGRRTILWPMVLSK